MPRTATILLPPSEGKAPAGRSRSRPWHASRHAFSVLDDDRREVVAALRGLLVDRPEQAGALLGVRGATLEAAVAADLAVDEAPAVPALRRYTGVLYDALGYASLDPTSRRRADARIVVLSGLWGLLGPRDPIPDYRLKMGAYLPGLGTRTVAGFWRPRLSPVLDERVVGTTVWDLLPGEHAAAWQADPGAPAGHLRVRFEQEAPDGTRSVVSHWSKRLKGLLVRQLLATGATDPAALRDVALDGYRLDPSATAVEGRTGTLVFAGAGPAAGPGR